MNSLHLIEQPYTGLRNEAGLQQQAAMLALAQRHPAENVHTVDLPYRLSSWALDDARAAALWITEAGDLAAWAVLQAPFWTLDYAYDPALGAALHAGILQWADGRARALAGTRAGRGRWFVAVLAEQVARQRDLAAAGFVCQRDMPEDAWSKVLMVRPGGATTPDCPLPPGFVVRPLAGEAEAAAYVVLHRAAFESENMTVEWRRRTIWRPERRPELDLVAVAPDGGLVAFCIGWLARLGAEGRPCGQVEPLGVRRDCRGLGLGRAILAEALRQLAELGAEQVLVETDNYRDAAFGLYSSAGFTVAHEVLVYRKDYDG